MQSPCYDGVVQTRAILPRRLALPDALARLGNTIAQPSPSPPSSSDATIITPLSWRIKSQTLLILTVASLLLFQICTSALLLAHGAYHWKMYTLWSYTMLTVFYAVLLAALLVQHVVLTMVVLFFLPIILGNVVFVAVAVTVIIANNAEVMIKGTVCGSILYNSTLPTTTPLLSMEALNTGHWTLHGFTLFGVLVLLNCGLDCLGRQIVLRSMQRFNPAQQWLYFLFWLFGPFILLATYENTEDVDKNYPTSFTLLQRTAIMAAIVLVWQLYSWAMFTARRTIDQLDAVFLPTVHELLDSLATNQPLAFSTVTSSTTSIASPISSTHQQQQQYRARIQELFTSIGIDDVEGGATTATTMLSLSNHQQRTALPDANDIVF
jgi:hypothetical protein